MTVPSTDQPFATEESPVFVTTGRVLGSVEGPAARGLPGGLSRDDLMARAAERATDADFLRENPPYFWSAEISSSRTDSYFTQMRDSTLRNFAADAEAGVSFLNSHDIRQLPFGASLAGRFHNGRGDTPARAVADFYTVPGLHTNSVNSDDLIRGIKSGVLRDVSVGFYGGRTMCSICNRDMEQGFWDWLFGEADEEDVCMHYPGMRYDVKDAEGKKTGEKVLCLGYIEDGRLAEVSQVYKGATPNAGVLKAQRASEAGKLPPDLARSLEQKYRIALPGPHRAWAGADFERARKESRSMADTEQNTEQREQPTTPAQPAPVGVEAGADERAVADALATAQREIERLNADLARLAPLADQARAYRADLIDQAVHQGKRAQGTAFPEEVFRAMLANADIEHIKATRDGFKQGADALVTPGARVNATLSDDGGAPAAPAGANGRVPDAAYRAR